MLNNRVPMPALVGASVVILAALVLTANGAAAKVNNSTTRSNTQHNVTQIDPARGQSVGRRRHHPLKIRRYVDSASPRYFRPIVHGTTQGK
jgi:type VI protein secretion system component Hcp